MRCPFCGNPDGSCYSERVERTVGGAEQKIGHCKNIEMKNRMRMGRGRKLGMLVSGLFTIICSIAFIWVLMVG